MWVLSICIFNHLSSWIWWVLKFENIAFIFQFTQLILNLKRGMRKTVRIVISFENSTFSLYIHKGWTRNCILTLSRTKSTLKWLNLTGHIAGELLVSSPIYFTLLISDTLIFSSFSEKCFPIRSIDHGFSPPAWSIESPLWVLNHTHMPVGSKN